MPTSSGLPMDENGRTPEATSRGQLPESVAYARSLLWLQGGIWALLAAGSSITIAVMLIEVLGGHQTWDSALTKVGWLPVAAVLTGVLAATKIRLARRLRGGRERIRKTVVVIEIAMTVLGAAMTAGTDPSGGIIAGFFVLAAIAGGGLSLVAVIGLLRRPARDYFAAPGSPGGATVDTSGDGNVACAWLIGGRVHPAVGL